MAASNWKLSSLEDGDQMWDKYKNSTEYRYHMSQTDITLNTKGVKLHLLDTKVEPDAIQPPKEELNKHSNSKHKAVLSASKIQRTPSSKKKKKDM